MAKYQTKQRKILQEYLLTRIDEELSAKQVADDLADQNISLSAVYRNLTEMEKDKEIVQYAKEGSREFYFRYVKNDDCMSCFHFSCKICSTIEHMPIEDTSFIKQHIGDRFSFDLDLTSTVFYGVCNNCQ